MLIDFTQAAQDVLAERERQRTGEGFKEGRDDKYTGGELAQAAATYAYFTSRALRFRKKMERSSQNASRGWYDNRRWLKLWPQSWDRNWWKPTDRRRDLVKAGALILAEIERIDRDAAEKAQP